MWGICIILTVTNVLEEGHPARTDARLRVLTDSAWFYVPYPGQQINGLMRKIHCKSCIVYENIYFCLNRSIRITNSHSCRCTKSSICSFRKQLEK